MRRLSRILLNAATVGSVLLCFTVLLDWQRGRQVTTHRWLAFAAPVPPGARVDRIARVGTADMRYVELPLRDPNYYYLAFGRIPITWAVAGMLALPAYWLARFGHDLYAGACARRDAPRGLCPACRYDLRATPGRCPECGTVPAPPA